MEVPFFFFVGLLYIFQLYLIFSRQTQCCYVFDQYVQFSPAHDRDEGTLPVSALIASAPATCPGERICLLSHHRATMPIFNHS